MKKENEIKSFYERFTGILYNDLLHKNRHHIKHMIALDQILKNKNIELQIIDEQIRSDEIWKLCKETGLIITSYNLFGIDYKNQYIMYKIENKI